jgi:uncharacterized membrane protein YfbV (UPF0208 family)
MANYVLREPLVIPALQITNYYESKATMEVCWQFGEEKQYSITAEALCLFDWVCHIPQIGDYWIGKRSYELTVGNRWVPKKEFEERFKLLE